MGDIRIWARGNACAGKWMACLALLAAPTLAQPAPEEKAPGGGAQTSAACSHALVPASGSGDEDPMDPVGMMRQWRQGLEGLTFPGNFCNVVVGTEPWPIPLYLGNFMKEMGVPRRPHPKDIESWEGSRPWDDGAYGNGYPLDLTVLAIEDYASRGSSDPALPGTLRCADGMAETWKRIYKDSLFLWPRAEVLKDGQVTAAEFTGPHPRAFREADMVIFMGHGSPLGPWLGALGDFALMFPANYNWSGGQAKWFVNASCKGLYDGHCCGEPDSTLLTCGNGGRDPAGHSITELGGWGKAMGWGTAAKDRLHAIFGFRSLAWFNSDSRQQGQSRDCPQILESRLGRNWEDYPAHTFIKVLMCSENGLAIQGLPTGMGDLWMYCANFQYRMTGIPGSAPAVLAYQATMQGDPSRVLLDYYDEAFHAPYPSPGRLGDDHALVLRCRTQVFGTPEF